MPEASVDVAGARVLLIDDRPENLSVLQRALESAGFNVLVATNGTQGLKVAKRTVPDLILLDVVMTGMDGFETCRRLKAEPVTRDIPVLFLTVRRETSDVVSGFAAGGVDYIAKPFQHEELLARVRTHLEKARLAQTLIEQNQRLEAEIACREALGRERNQLAGRLSMISQHETERWGIAGLVGRSQAIQQILEEIDLLRQTPNASVLITGESGTGKELIARALHFGGPRAEGPFVAVNSAAVPADLAESRLFGHVRGAFTGAESDRIGSFELADGGTLFLDEIGAMPTALQPKLLRVLEDGRFLPVGAKQERTASVRLVCATNADLQSEMAAGRFRPDLYFRLARFVVRAPALRERREDVPLLSRHFIAVFAREMNLEPPALSPQALEALASYHFPGNVRELKNIVERALIYSRGAEIRPEHLQFAPQVRSGPSPTPDPVTPAEPGTIPLELEGATRWAVERALVMTDGNVAAAARLLGTSRTRIYRLLQRERGERHEG